MLTVADIVAIEALELTLRGGAAGSGRPVRWVHISELRRPHPVAAGRRAPAHHRAAARRRPGRLRRAAGGRRASPGSAWGSGFGYDAAPAEAVAAADRLGFPLFKIPYEVPFIAITEAVFTRLSDARVAEAVRRLAGDLVEAVLAGEVGPRELRRRARAFGLRGHPADGVRRPAAGDPRGRASGAAGRGGRAVRARPASATASWRC